MAGNRPNKLEFDRFLGLLLISLTVCSTSISAENNDQQLHNGHKYFKSGYYHQRNLVTNFVDKYKTRNGRNRKTLHDKYMLNAWGLALRPAGAGGHWWIANTDSGTVSTYVGDSRKQPLFQDNLKRVGVESSPLTPTEPATPTGQVFNGSEEFPCTGETFSGDTISAPGKFIVVTEDGNIQCWGETGSTLPDRMKSFVISATGEPGSVYKGLAVTNVEDGNRLYAANFGLQRIEVYDGQFNDISTLSFEKPTDIPESFAPFNIQYFEYRSRGLTRQSLFIAYAKTTNEPGEEEQGPGLGYLAEFDTEGNHITTFEHSQRLNAPWGMAIAPKRFGRFSRTLVLGNFGDGTLVAFDLESGQQKGYLRNRDGQAVQIDGLWGLAFGNGESLGRSNYLYFTAGPNGENDGLFGSLNWRHRR